MTKNTLILAALFAALLALGACQGDPMTHDNGAPKLTKAETPAPSGQSCTCTKNGTYCQVEGGGATLHCEMFTGGCATDNQCKVNPTASKFNACPAGQIWDGNTSWTAATAATFTCVDKAESCVNVGCKGYYTCNSDSGKCEKLPDGFFQCESLSCPAGVEKFCSGNVAVSYTRYGSNVCTSLNGTEVCAMQGSSEVDVNCANGCDSATGICKEPSGNPNPNPGPGDIQCAFWRTDSTAWDYLMGGGIVDASQAWSVWESLGKPNTNGVVTFTLKAGDIGLALLAHVDAKHYSRGYVTTPTDIQVFGKWAVKCDGLATRYIDSSTPITTGFPSQVGAVSRASLDQNTHRFFYHVR